MGRYVVGTGGLRVKYTLGVQRSDLAWLALRSGAGAGALAFAYGVGDDDVDDVVGLGPGPRGSYSAPLKPDPDLDLELVPHLAFGAAMDRGWHVAARIAERLRVDEVELRAKGTFTLRRRDWSTMAAWIGRFVRSGPPPVTASYAEPETVGTRLKPPARRGLPGMAVELLAHAVAQRLDTLTVEDEDPAWSAKLLPLAKRDRARVAELLHEAVSNGREDDVVALLALRPDVNARDDDGLTLLGSAAREGEASIAERLIAAGARLDLRSDGYPLLHHAAQGGLARLTRRLLDDGCDPNLRADDDDTPLITAAFGGHAATVRLLLSRGADPTLVNHAGRTARSYAKKPAVKALLATSSAPRAARGSAPSGGR